jgi:hypothetical protein
MRRRARTSSAAGTAVRQHVPVDMMILYACGKRVEGREDGGTSRGYSTSGEDTSKRCITGYNFASTLLQSSDSTLFEEASHRRSQNKT